MARLIARPRAQHLLAQKRRMAGRVYGFNKNFHAGGISRLRNTTSANNGILQRQTFISEFYQMDRLVVEGGMSVGSNPGDLASAALAGWLVGWLV